MLERQPARAALDARIDEQRQTPRRQIASNPARHRRRRRACRASRRGSAGARAASSVFTPACARCTRSSSATGVAGRMPVRSSASSLSAAAHTGHASSSRASMPATAPHGAKFSARPRRRSNAVRPRVVHERVLAAKRPAPERLERGARARPGRGRIDDQHRVMLAAEARRDHECAHADIDSRDSSGGMHRKLKPSTACSANSPVRSSAEPITS